MRLAKLLGDTISNIDVDVSLLDLNVAGVTCDSRKLNNDYLFGALPGSKTDGRKFIESAIAGGATIILAPIGTKGKLGCKVPIIEHENVRKAFAILASNFYCAQPELVALVTGTNGKTSVVNFAHQMWSRLGVRSANIGTLGIQENNRDFSQESMACLTTPEPADLYNMVSNLTKKDINYLAIEASSHGLSQHRLDGLSVKLAAFTNLSQDHMDYHITEESYFNAKKRLFSELLLERGTAVLNIDSHTFKGLSDVSKSRNCQVITYGEAKADIQLLKVDRGFNYQKVTVSLFGRIINIKTRLIGKFQILNALCGSAIVMGSGFEPDNVINMLECLEGVPGRLQLAGSLSNGAKVYIDYAHTPHALKTVLQALRPYASKRIHVVIGCGGERDKSKRSIMGEVASIYADKVIVTDDNPRGEDPEKIRNEILKGCPNAVSIANRREAICSGINGLRRNDFLIIAGKGHEQGQSFRDETVPFDDLLVAQNAIKNIEKGLSE